jgi:hypothetical protein
VCRTGFSPAQIKTKDPCGTAFDDMAASSARQSLAGAGQLRAMHNVSSLLRKNSLNINLRNLVCGAN